MSLSKFNPVKQPVITVLFLLWVDLLWVVRGEWIYNDQYSYGWLCLFLSLYLLYIRALNRPAGSPSRSSVAVPLLFSILILTLNRVVLESNPVWRSAIWLHALVIFGTTGALFWRMGGWVWVRHFMPAFALMLFAIPWPTFIENSVTGGLMRMVSGVVVEGMNFCGFYAEQSGNLIRLRNGWVGIEAACSGVRNFQSTLMSAWFVGELFRFTLTGRGLLLVLSGVASLTINVGRTSLLTWTTYQSGSNLTESIHDPVGHVVSAIAFVFLMVVAFCLRKSFGRPDVGTELVPSVDSGDKETGSVLLSRRAFGAFVAVFLGGYLLVEMWYYRVEGSLPEPQAIEVNWDDVPAAAIEFVDIAPAIRGKLKYTDGSQAEWVDVDGRSEWQVFSFAWTKGSVSPFLGVHNPRTCMSASGFRQAATHPPLVFTLGAQRLEFEVSTFYFLDRPYQVYYATWSDSSGPATPVVESTGDRLRLAWSGRRVTNRRSLQIIIENVERESVARQKALGFLDTALYLKTSDSAE